MFGQMVHTVLPSIEFLSTETAAASDECGFGFPHVHAFNHLATVYESQVLSQVIFPVERPCIKAFIFAKSVVMRDLSVFVGGILLATVDTLPLSTGSDSDYRAERCADPLFQTEMQ
jgi:hypothetical protein